MLRLNSMTVWKNPRQIKRTSPLISATESTWIDYGPSSVNTCVTFASDATCSSWAHVSASQCGNVFNLLVLVCKMPARVVTLDVYVWSSYWDNHLPGFDHFLCPHFSRWKNTQFSSWFFDAPRFFTWALNLNAEVLVWLSKNFFF